MRHMFSFVFVNLCLIISCIYWIMCIISIQLEFARILFGGGLRHSRKKLVKIDFTGAHRGIIIPHLFLPAYEPLPQLAESSQMKNPTAEYKSSVMLFF